MKRVIFLIYLYSLNLFSQENLQSTIAKLDDIVFQNITTSNPFVLHCMDDNPIDAFCKSSYDWHSSIHAHWSILAMSRLKKDFIKIERKEVVLKRVLNKTFLKKIKSMLVREIHPLSTDLYSMSWLNVLFSELIEFNYITDRDLKSLIIKIKKNIEKRISRLLKNEEKLLENEKNSFLGKHSSWLFNYFLNSHLVAKNIDEKLVNYLNKYRTNFTWILDNITAYKYKNNDFIDLESIYNLSFGQGLSQRSIVYSDLISLEVNHQSSDYHQWGRFVMQSWGKLEFEENSSDIFLELYDSLLDQMSYVINPEIQGSESIDQKKFKTVAHWVPQFIWIGIYLKLKTI